MLIYSFENSSSLSRRQKSEKENYAHLHSSLQLSVREGKKPFLAFLDRGFVILAAEDDLLLPESGLQS